MREDNTENRTYRDTSGLTDIPKRVREKLNKANLARARNVHDQQQ